MSSKEQCTDGTQRLEEPVSKITVKFWGGVPIPITPKYWACKAEEGNHEQRQLAKSRD